jgi:hypothetical protein
MTREASVATLRRLAEAVDAYGKEMRVFETPGVAPLATCYRQLSNALAAYRSEIAPLRTREQVDADIAALTRQCVDDEWAGDDDYAKWEKITALCRELTRDSGPSSADGEEVPSPRPPASPAGADLIQRLALLERYLGPSAIEWARSQMPSGPPGAVAAKESTDNAAAPEGAALEDVEACGCEEADRLNGYMRDIKFLHRQWSDEKGLAGSILTQIGSVVLRWMSNLP